MRLVVVVLLGIVAAFVGITYGWRFVLAPLLFLAIWTWARATLRSFASHGQTGVAATTQPEVVVDAAERTFYWCAECDTEVLLLVRGSGIAPRHCGSRMAERSEVLDTG